MFSKASKQFTSFHKYINTSAAAGIAYQKYKQSKQLPDIKPDRFQAVTDTPTMCEHKTLHDHKNLP